MKHPYLAEKLEKAVYNGFIVPPNAQFEAMIPYLGLVVNELRKLEDKDEDFGRAQRKIILGAKGGHLRMGEMDDDAIMEFKQALFELFQLCESGEKQ